MAGRNWLVAIIAIMLGLVAVVIANAWFSGMKDKQEQVTQTDTRTVKVVVATQPLEFGGKLTPQNLKLVDWPAASVPQGAYRTLPEALADNRVALRPIAVGEPILSDKVSGKDGRATLAALLPDGMRAYSVPVDVITGVSGFVLPGTMVDVVLTRGIPGVGTDAEDLRSDVLLTNVEVLAVDQGVNDKDGTPKVSHTATLAVSLYDVQRLSLATKMGTLSLALRKVESAAGSTELAANTEPASTTLIGRRITSPPLRVVRRDGPSSTPTPFRFALAPRTAAPRNTPGLPGGASMTVFRGAEPTVYPVGFMGGR